MPQLKPLISLATAAVVGGMYPLRWGGDLTRVAACCAELQVCRDNRDFAEDGCRDGSCEVCLSVEIVRSLDRISLEVYSEQTTGSHPRNS